jgi:hypothetical protein
MHLPCIQLSKNNLGFRPELKAQSRKRYFIADRTSALSIFNLDLLSSQALPVDSEHLGGGERDRTDDLLRAKQVLSQLSYTPKPTCGIPKSGFEVVGLVGIEPTTSRLSGVRSNRN